MRGEIWGPVKGFDFRRGVGGLGEGGQHFISIFTIRIKISKYLFFHVIILIVEKRQSVV